MFDFVILTLPRSGSHMLASALDGHSQIQCFAEAWREKPRYEWLGGIKKSVVGTTVFPRYAQEIVPTSGKAIVLTRRPEDRASTEQKIETLVPLTVDSRDIGTLDCIDVFEREADALLKTAKDFTCLYLDYSDLTEDKDCREIPEWYARQICEFLGVNYEPLRPKFYKPQRI